MRSTPVFVWVLLVRLSVCLSVRLSLENYCKRFARQE